MWVLLHRPAFRSGHSHPCLQTRFQSTTAVVPCTTGGPFFALLLSFVLVFLCPCLCPCPFLCLFLYPFLCPCPLTWFFLCPCSCRPCGPFPPIGARRSLVAFPASVVVVGVDCVAAIALGMGKAKKSAELLQSSCLKRHLSCEYQHVNPPLNLV